MINAIQADTVFRAATVEDCPTIAHLFQIASDGVSNYVWSTLASEYPGLTLLEIGAKRYTNQEGFFSYKNCVLAERNGEIIGMMLTFPVADTENSEAIAELTPSVTHSESESPAAEY